MAVKGFFFNALKFHKLPIRLKPRMTDFTLPSKMRSTRFLTKARASSESLA